MKQMGFRFSEKLYWVFVAVFMFATFARQMQGQSAAQVPYNIILLTPDQLAAQYMHTYDYPYPDTPNIDRLATEGTVFLHAYSAGSWTTPSFGSILTGLFPTVHGMTLPPYEGCGLYITMPLTKGKLPPVPPDLLLSPNKPILPELLKPVGVISAADNANCWSIWDIASRGWDALKFFSAYQLSERGAPGAIISTLTAPDTTGWAENWLTAHKDSRFFLWVHYMEPHTPYNAPPQYDLFKTPDDYPDFSVLDSAEGRRLYELATLGDARAIHRLEQLYAAKILYADRYIGHLLDTIRNLGLKRNTIVIFLSDHGQLLYSHPRDFNTDDHRSLYDAVQQIPLLFWGVTIQAGRRVPALAGQYDIVPTILDLEGLPLPKDLDGKSLKPVLTGTEDQVHRYIYGEESVLTPQYSVRDSRYKLIETMRTGVTQCFDLQVDPNEKNSICNRIPDVAATLRVALDEHIAGMITQAKSYPDWQRNQALAVLEQRDTPQLIELTPRDITVGDSGAEFQLTGRGWWNVAKDGEYWAPRGTGSAWARWCFDTPMIGNYEISLWWGASPVQGMPLATDAEFTLHFKGGTLTFPENQNLLQNHWVVLGRFQDPISVLLTNRANGLVLAGTVRFKRLQ